MAEEYCLDPEGWGPVSPIRDFDLTPCFEEGILLSASVVVLGVLGSYRIHTLWSLEERPRFNKSRWLLGTKIVSGGTRYLDVDRV